MKVFVFDPGLTTGVISAEPDLSSPVRMVESIRETMCLWHVKMPNEEVGTLRLWELMLSCEPDRVIGEDFRLFPDVPHRPDPRGTAPDRILARIDLLMYMVHEYELELWPFVGGWLLPREVIKQMPGERTVVTDKWLREHELWRTPKHITGAVTGDSNHAMDALRHLIVFCRKEMK
jgi:hypothetical protein